MLKNSRHIVFFVILWDFSLFENLKITISFTLTFELYMRESDHSVYFEFWGISRNCGRFEKNMIKEKNLCMANGKFKMEDWEKKKKSVHITAIGKGV